MKTIFVVLGTLIGLGLFILIFIIPFTGLHIETSNGEHVGYITSVEKNGLFFKTYTTYIKTDIQSSQEDEYCVIDESIISQLKRFAESKTHVKIEYFDWFSKGIANCSGEMGGIISAVSETK